MWLVLGHIPGCGINVSCVVLFYLFFIGIQRGSGVDWRLKGWFFWRGFCLSGRDFVVVPWLVYHFDLCMFIDTSLLCIALLDADEIQKK
jgi:hypothetical protein